jgi:hypothetical protein
MTNDITLKAKAYEWLYSSELGSARRSITDGAVLPHDLKISHIDVTDGKTKLAMRQSKMFLAMSHLDTGGVNPAAAPITVQVTVRKGVGVNAPSTVAIELAIDSVVQALTGTGADASALDLADDIFANEEQ